MDDREQSSESENLEPLVECQDTRDQLCRASLIGTVNTLCGRDLGRAYLSMNTRRVLYLRPKVSGAQEGPS